MPGEDLIAPGELSIQLSQLAFTYPGSRFTLAVPQFHLAAGECIALIGPSGSGKTTLGKLIAGILRPDEGQVTVLGHNMTAMSDAERRRFRARRIGFVFQEFELLPYLNARDNIRLPFRFQSGLEQDDLGTLADSLGIESLLKRKPAQLSQGERQRVAIARALITKPGLVLADEPTGNLDPAHAARTLDLLVGQVRQRGTSLLMITHDHSLLDRFDSVIDLNNLGAAACSD